MTDVELRALVVETAQRWLGRNERNGSYRIIIDTYNAHRPLPRRYHLRDSDPWCAATVSALAIVTHLTALIPVECSCGYMIDLLRGLEAWQEADDYRPLPGDIIFYDWQDNGFGDDAGAADHVGIVETVSESGLTVIEGNRGGTVARRELALNGRYIRGYGTPDYGAEAASRSLEELARLGVINTPAYWRRLLVCGRIRYLGQLLCSSAAAIRAFAPRAESAEQGLEALVSAGVVNSPDYWTGAMEAQPNVGELIRALGGAVRA